MAKSKSAARKYSNDQRMKKSTNGATRRKILEQIKKPHKKTATKEEKKAFKNFLKRIKDRDIKLQESGEAIQPGGADGDLLYEVEEILDASIKDGKLHYMVLWKDHTLDNFTWEPESSMGACMDLIDEFYERFPKKSGGPKATKPRKVAEE